MYQSQILVISRCDQRGQNKKKEERTWHFFLSSSSLLFTFLGGKMDHACIHTTYVWKTSEYIYILMKSDFTIVCVCCCCVLLLCVVCCCCCCCCCTVYIKWSVDERVPGSEFIHENLILQRKNNKRTFAKKNRDLYIILYSSPTKLITLSDDHQVSCNAGIYSISTISFYSCSVKTNNFRRNRKLKLFFSFERENWSVCGSTGAGSKPTYMPCMN